MLTQRFSDHWPVGADWPADIPRPQPSPGSPTAESCVEPLLRKIADPAEAVRCLKEQAADLYLKGDPAAAAAQLDEAERVAMRVDPKTGRFASVAALAALVGCSPQDCSSAIGRFSGAEGVRRKPRRAYAKRLVRLFVESKDVRFGERRALLHRQTDSAADEAAGLAGAWGAGM